MIEGYFVGGPWDKQFRVLEDERLQWTVAIAPESFDWDEEQPDKPFEPTTGTYRRVGNVSYIWDGPDFMPPVGGGSYWDDGATDLAQPEVPLW